MATDDNADLEKLLLRELLRHEMTAQELAVLRVLQGGNTNPSEIYRTLTTDYESTMPQSTLYQLVQKLAAQHLVIKIEEDRTGSGRPKHIYALAERGRELLAQFDLLRGQTNDQYRTWDLSPVYTALSEAVRLIDDARSKLQGE